MNTQPPAPENDPPLSDLGRALMATQNEGSKPAGGGPWIPPAPEELQKELPQYEVTQMLGRGGMGAVYMGRQKSLDRPVAIKILSGVLEEADAGFSARFKNEARAMAKLSHPGIVAVHDFGETASGLLYIVMEYVEGTDVARMIASKGRLHTDHAMAITAHVCDALAYAHERGIIHRDIKPANIMVGYDGVVKVADFGLAKVTSSNASTGLTQSNVVMGTLHYMAPEALILGTAVDHRADIYAVGVMLYQMLTGKIPQGMFKLPSLQIPGLDPRYDAIIAKGIMEDREARYQSVGEMRRDLDGILTQPVVKVEAEGANGAPAQAPAALPTVARPQRPGARSPKLGAPPAPRAPETASKGWLVWTALGIIALLGGGYAWMNRRPPAPPAQVAVAASQPSQSAAPPSVTTPPPAAPATQRSTPPDIKSVEPRTGMTVPAPVVVPPPLDPNQLPDIRTRIANYQKARHVQLNDLATKYRAALTAEKDAATKSGVLASVTAADAAIGHAAAFAQFIEANLASTEVKPMPALAPVADPAPPRLKELRDIFIKETAKIEGTLITGLDSSLATVQASLVKAAQVDAAKAVETYRRDVIAAFGMSADTPVATASPSQPATTATGAAFLQATKDKPFVNSLGMKFVPVPGTKVLMCIHETRKGDYAAYAAANTPVDSSWQTPVEQGHAVSTANNHPVVEVNRDDALAFCTWLSKKEGHAYRLPTDREWSVAVGIGDLEPADGTPSNLNHALKDLRYWGKEWPPRRNMLGNYSDKTYKAMFPSANAIDNGKSYDDGVALIAPVMSFPPNGLGIFDLDGNVWEWVQDFYDGPRHEAGLARGSNWAAGHPDQLLASHRQVGSKGTRSSHGGFRVVIEPPSSATTNGKAAPAITSTPISAPPAGSPSPTPVTAAKDSPFINSLGMKFVPVPGTKVLMCIHETRKADFTAYADASSISKRGWESINVDGEEIQYPEDHPVSGIAYQGAESFCAWLSQKEGLRYRLPTDREWSMAVGIGSSEPENTPPATLHDKMPGVYSWGSDVIPPAGSGNFADLAMEQKFPRFKTIPGYTDGHATTAPVMSFKANNLGIHDLAGNVWEWCADWWDEANQERIIRGGSWDSKGALLGRPGAGTPGAMCRTVF